MSGWQRIVGEWPGEVTEETTLLRGVNAALSEADVPPELTCTLSRIPYILAEVPAHTDSVIRQLPSVLGLVNGCQTHWQNRS